ncbi:MAG: tRNA (guanosine(46)-N7)-methyltransferase TrmB [Phycisphaerales bacterium]
MSFGLAHGRMLDVGNIGLAMSTLCTGKPGTVDPRSLFVDDVEPPRRCEIEIGTGKGTFLLQQAKLQEQVNFLGFEWTSEFYRYTADRIRRRELRNVRVVHGDATEFLCHWCCDDVIDVIHLYFSDPWPKKRHHKRRVIQDHTLVAMHRALRKGGEVRIVTDHDDLWQWCVDHAQRHEQLFQRQPFAGVDSAAAGEMVGSNFERKYAREGRPFHAMTLVKRTVSQRPD